MDLLEPFGYVHSADSICGRGTVEITLYADPGMPLETVAAARAYVLGRAGEVIAALEADGREIHEIQVTLRGVPVEATMRLEVSGKP